MSYTFRYRATSKTYEVIAMCGALKTPGIKHRLEAERRVRELNAKDKAQELKRKITLYEASSKRDRDDKHCRMPTTQNETTVLAWWESGRQGTVLEFSRRVGMHPSTAYSHIERLRAKGLIPNSRMNQ